MDITNKNFLECLPEIEEAIENADFLSFDGEMSGLRKDSTLNILDSIAERYEKTYESCKGYVLVQAGLSCFKVSRLDTNSGKLSLKCKTYNFYIFPQKYPVNKAVYDRTFQVQTTALQFLSSHGFDMNKLIRDGVSYMTFAEEVNMRNAYEESLKNKPDNDRHIDASRINPEDQSFVDANIKSLDELVSAWKEDKKSKNDLTVPAVNAYKRRLLYEAIDRKPYSDVVQIRTEGEGALRPMFILLLDPEEKNEENEKLLKSAFGFSHIVKLIISREKPLVGHNFLLDLIHIMNQFVGPIPEKYDDFKSLCRNLFPNIFDTKAMANSIPFKEHFMNTSLEELISSIRQKPFDCVDVELLNGDYSAGTGSTFHEAGYDSYVTGICFASMATFLSRHSNQPRTEFSLELLSHFRNKLNLMYHYDYTVMDLNKDRDPQTQRNHIFHVSFPSDWKNKELTHLFSAFGNIRTAWIDDTSAYCILLDESKAGEAKKYFANLTAYQKCRVVPYNKFIERKDRLVSSSNDKNNMSRSEGDCKKVARSSDTDQGVKEIVAAAKRARLIETKTILLPSDADLKKKDVFEEPTFN